MGRELGEALALLDRVVEEAAAGLQRLAGRSVGAWDLYGAGALLHSYYTVAEKIFERIARRIDLESAAGTAWHRELLDRMTRERPGVRPRVLKDETAASLRAYLQFRHLFRNLYFFDLRWDPMRLLLERLPGTQALLRADLDAFMKFLANLESLA